MWRVDEASLDFVPGIAREHSRTLYGSYRRPNRHRTSRSFPLPPGAVEGSDEAEGELEVDKAVEMNDGEGPEESQAP